ncbi:MAG: hypothetical protein AB1634_16595 [Thermodesulfobacteriota bacterium]
MLWGLELLAQLHRAGGLPGHEASRIAQAIRKSNPTHITADILTRFLSIIRRQEDPRFRP